MAKLRQAASDNVTATIEQPSSKMAMIEAPLSESNPTGYIPRALNMRLSAKQAVTLKRMFHALSDRHARLENGHHVDSYPDAIRWILEELLRQS